MPCDYAAFVTFILSDETACLDSYFYQLRLIALSAANGSVSMVHHIVRFVWF